MREVPNYRYLHIASHEKMNDVDANLSKMTVLTNCSTTFPINLCLTPKK